MSKPTHHPLVPTIGPEVIAAAKRSVFRSVGRVSRGLVGRMGEPTETGTNLGGMIIGRAPGLCEIAVAESTTGHVGVAFSEAAFNVLRSGEQLEPAVWTRPDGGPCRLIIRTEKAWTFLDVEPMEAQR